MVEIKLPKCLTEKEANLIRDYNDLILSKLPEEKRARMIPQFLASVDCPQRGPRYSPFKSIDDVETNTECFNKKLYMGLLDAYEANTYDNSLPTPEVVLMLFNGAYAMSIHALNHKNPELYYEEDYRNIWWTGKVDAVFGNEIDVHMEHICACMIYRILEAENNPRYDVLLRKIKNLIKRSYFVEADTLDLFKHTIVSATPLTPTTEDTPINNTQTEQKTTEEEEPQESPTAAPAATPVPEPSTQKERIRAAISRLLDRRREDGVKFCAKHWYAVYRVLAARELVAENMKAFAELMNEMGFSDCKRQNLNSAQKEQKLPSKISEWFGRTRYEGGDKKLADVAQVFLSILREDKL